MLWTLATAAGACERSAQWQQALCLLSTARQELLGSSGYNRPVGKASRRWRVMISNSSYRSRTIWWLIKLFCRVDGWGMFNSYDTRLEQAFLNISDFPGHRSRELQPWFLLIPICEICVWAMNKRYQKPCLCTVTFFGEQQGLLGQQKPTGTFWLVY